MAHSVEFSCSYLVCIEQCLPGGLPPDFPAKKAGSCGSSSIAGAPRISRQLIDDFFTLI